MDWPILQFPVANDKIYILTLFVDRFILEDVPPLLAIS